MSLDLLNLKWLLLKKLKSKDNNRVFLERENLSTLSYYAASYHHACPTTCSALCQFCWIFYQNFQPGTIIKHLGDLGWKSLKQKRDASTIILFNQDLTLSSILLSRSFECASDTKSEHLSTPPRPSRHMHTKHTVRPYAPTDTDKHSFVPRAVFTNLEQSPSVKNAFT